MSWSLFARRVRECSLILSLSPLSPLLLSSDIERTLGYSEAEHVVESVIDLRVAVGK